MRRRFGKYVDKIFDRPRSPSPANPRPVSSAQTSHRVSFHSNPNVLTDRLNTLNARYHDVQHKELKQSISQLVTLLAEVTGQVEDEVVLNKLADEINRISDVPLILQKRNNLSEIHGQLDGFASSITSATTNAQVLITKDSTKGAVGKLGITNAFLGLGDELRLAIDEFESTIAKSGSAPKSSSKAPRAVSGWVVGALTIGKEALDCVPVPGLKSAVGGLLEALKAINKLVDNEDDLVKLGDHVQRLMEIITPPSNTVIDMADASLRSRISDLTKDIQQVTIEAKTLEEQNRIQKFLGTADNASMITGLSKAIDQAVNRFQVSGGIAIERGLASLKDILLRMESKHLSADEETALNIIQPRAGNARYDSPSQTSSSFCLENTRVSILNKVEQWVADPAAPPIFWLCGMAGTGKSTIARTVAKRIDEIHSLGATFFFSRDEGDRQTTNMVFPTIAYQLARRNSSFRPSIVNAANPDVCTAMMRTQLQKLIVEPLQHCDATAPSPVVIVMDALDECTDESQITEMLILLAPAIRTLQKAINIKLFLTSRPEVHISSEFSEPGMGAVSDVSVLHDIEKSLVQADIRRYIEHHLARIAKVMLPTSASWPLPHEIDMLVDLADGLFIFAAVTVAYVGDTKHRQPKQRLRNVLSAAAHDQRTRSLKHLDTLYQKVLIASLPDGDEGDDNQETVDRILSILGAVVLLMNPLSTRSLERLLRWEEDTAEAVLGPFHSILSVPSYPNPVRVFHKSFPDFLTDEKRSGDLWFHLNPSKHHTELALLCLNHMNSSLERDMCGVGDQLVSEIENIDVLLQTKVQDHVMYSCQHWGNHLKEADHTEELDNALSEFSMTKLLYWLEIMSLSGKLAMGIPLLKSAEEWCKNQTTKSMLYDCYRFLLYFHKTIALGPWHIYHSALPFIPRCDLFTTWKPELGDSVVVKRGRAKGWNADLFTLSGHTGTICSVAYSPDSTRLASGAYDHTIIIWDCKAGVQINTLTGHSNKVQCVAFSPDSTQIASGGSDETVRVWNSRTGAQIHVLSNYSSTVNAVVYSPDGSFLASGSDDNTIILWSVGTWSVARVLSGHRSCVSAVIFSPDGTRIVSGSVDGSIAIWDPLTGTHLKSLWGSKAIKSVAFSPDGTRIASCTCFRTIDIWDFHRGVLIITLKGHSALVNSIAFSPDGKWMVSASYKTIGIWDAKGPHLINKLRHGHSDKACSVAVSPDSTQIAFGSSDQSVIVWDINSIVASGKPEMPHTDHILSIAFSPDGNQIASGSADRIIVTWDTKTGEPINTLRGHYNAINRVVYSPDSKYIASGSDDCSVKIWDSQTGALVRSLIHECCVRGVSFSPDGLHLVSLDEYGRYHQRDIQILRDFSYSPITREEAEALLSNPAAEGVVATRRSLEREGGSPWVLMKSQGKIIERVCFLSHHGISTHSSLGHTFAYGTTSGMVCILDFSRRLAAM